MARLPGLVGSDGWAGLEVSGNGGVAVGGARWKQTRKAGKGRGVWKKERLAIIVSEIK